MRVRSTLFAATMLASAFAGRALAQPVSGPYVSLGGGYALQSAIKAKNFSLNGTTLPGSANMIFKNGYGVEASAGYGFNNGWRVEVEGNYLNNKLNKVKADGMDYAASGHNERYGAFVNGIFDFDVSLPWLYPYLGAGIGWQQVDYKNFQSGLIGVNQSHNSLAYQGIVGMSFPIAPVMGLSATAEYRFIGLATARKYRGDVAMMPGSFKSQGAYTNVFNIGLRYEFAPPAPPAPAPTPAEVSAPASVPAPVPAKTYLVFFDWDKYSLTPSATQIIQQAADNSKTANLTTLSVNGYTDTSGGASYNMGLSIRRAKTVAAQLIADGVSSSEIEIHGFGETHLLVPTGPGVREPQNRRVEIILH